MKKTLLSLALALLLVFNTATYAFATSGSQSTTNSSLSATLTSNAWIQTISDLDGTGEFQVSAVYSSTNSAYKNPDWIKTAWDFYAIGIGVSIKFTESVSSSVGGSGYTSTSSGYWINSNGANTAWWRGRVGVTGLALYIGLYNTASAYKAGVTMSTTVKI